MKLAQWTAIGLVIALATSSASAAIVGPYTPDADTLHLWHLDEASGFTGTVSNAVGGGLAIEPVRIEDHDDDTDTLAAGFDESGIMGAAGATGFGNAADISGGARYGIGTVDSDTMNPVDTVNVMDDTTGAFTIEALITTSAIDSNQEIVSMESQNFKRPFQFRVNGSGELEWHGISGGSQHTAAIPTTGDDAFVADQWFHAAVTYDGEGGLKLYWTKLDDSRIEANELATFTGVGDQLDTGDTAPLVLGNEARVKGSEGLQGLIDEVRVSNVARGADGMMFVIPEPATLALLGLGALGLALKRHRR